MIALVEANNETQKHETVHRHEVYGIYLAKHFTQPVNEIERIILLE